jgi:hypothetical protein
MICAPVSVLSKAEGHLQLAGISIRVPRGWFLWFPWSKGPDLTVTTFAFNSQRAMRHQMGNPP